DGSACFFFQAEDGIRDGHVTGVQTCALPIWLICVLLSMRQRSGRAGASSSSARPGSERRVSHARRRSGSTVVLAYCTHAHTRARSEERRVGKECRYGWGGGAEKRKTGEKASG